MAWLEAANSRDTMSKQQRYDVGKEFGKTTGKDNKTSQRHSCDDVTSGVKNGEYNFIIY